MYNGIKPGMMKYCVVGNIVRMHSDKDGTTCYGTASFPSGRKVYISRRLWEDEVVVLGLNRYKSRYAEERIPLAWVENIRFSKTFDVRVLERMRNTHECPDMWWLYREEDRIGAAEYAKILNRVKAGDKEALEQDVMNRFYN